MNSGAGSHPAWDRALRALSVLAVDPIALGGLVLRAAPGPVRDVWLATFDALAPDYPRRRIPLHISESRLIGGLDLAATLKTGKPVHERGLLADCDGGVALLAMAERTAAQTVAHLCAALDAGTVTMAREGMTKTSPAAFGLIALDEGLEDETIAPALSDRLTLWIDLHSVSVRDVADPAVSASAIVTARECWHGVEVTDTISEHIALATHLLGVHSPRAWLGTVKVARILAALAGRTTVADEDASHAIELVLGHRATRLPSEPPPTETEDNQPPEQASDDRPQPPPQEPPPPEPSSPDSTDSETHQTEQEQDPGDAVVDAVTAAIPPELLQHLQAGLGRRRGATTGGKSGNLQKHRSRGRPVGTQPGDPRHGNRLNILATLRAAIPQQPFRQQVAPNGSGNRAALSIRKDDFQVVRFKHRTESTTIFVVDASGSSAIHRLAEAKGAVELLLADCYVRRDQVALIAFRGEQAELLLPPTRSLVRAKRCLSALPGGGGTPLGSAVDLTCALIPQIERKGSSAGVVFLTDGLANIARDGRRGREAAAEDALAAAKNLRALGTRCLVIDSAPRPQPRAKTFAEALDATYVAMPSVSADSLRGVVKSAGLQA